MRISDWSSDVCSSDLADPHFLGAFKGALPGHYRYNQRMYAHFMQDDMPAEQRGIFIAGDDVSWTPAWVEGEVQNSLNAVWGTIGRASCGGRVCMIVSISGVDVAVKKKKKNQEL